MVLFRPLDGNVGAEVEHHNTGYKKYLCKRYQDTVTASGPDQIARAVKKVMGVEDSKWREAVTAQTKPAKKNAGSRVKEMTRFENTLQLDFKASMRLTTWDYYPSMPGKGARVYTDSSGMFVCVYCGGSMMYVLTLPAWFWTWPRQDTVSRSDSNEFIMTSMKSQPEMECLIRLTWDWLYSPDSLHLNWRLKNRKSLVPIDAEDESLWLAELWCEFLVPSISHPSRIYHPSTKICVIWSVHFVGMSCTFTIIS